MRESDSWVAKIKWCPGFFIYQHFLWLIITTQSIQAGIINKLSGLTRHSSGLYVQNSTAGTNSAWKQDSDYWTSKGLSPNTRYGFTARARNGDSDVTPWCLTDNIYTLATVPGPASFSNINQNGITANWTPNGNPKGTMFYCENITTGTNSGWTDSLSWVCKGLVCNTLYTFRVMARNGNGVETEWRELGSQLTLSCPGYDGDFNGDGDVDGSDLVELANDPSLLALSDFAANFGRAD